MIYPVSNALGSSFLEFPIQKQSKSRLPSKESKWHLLRKCPSLLVIEAKSFGFLSGLKLAKSVWAKDSFSVLDLVLFV